MCPEEPQSRPLFWLEMCSQPGVLASEGVAAPHPQRRTGELLARVPFRQERLPEWGWLCRGSLGRALAQSLWLRDPIQSASGRGQGAAVAAPLSSWAGSFGGHREKGTSRPLGTCGMPTFSSPRACGNRVRGTGRMAAHGHTVAAVASLVALAGTSFRSAAGPALPCLLVSQLHDDRGALSTTPRSSPSSGLQRSSSPGRAAQPKETWRAGGEVDGFWTHVWCEAAAEQGARRTKLLLWGWEAPGLARRAAHSGSLLQPGSPCSLPRKPAAFSRSPCPSWQCAGLNAAPACLGSEGGQECLLERAPPTRGPGPPTSSSCPVAQGRRQRSSQRTFCVPAPPTAAAPLAGKEEVGQEGSCFLRLSSAPLPAGGNIPVQQQGGGAEVQ